ncbi:acetyltransferase, GNAT family [Lachnospiraceae bacterium KM106-2]|nr:acetyltransferase, GNAT family [Lachnospiraceae bacterium KM106-2]
MNNMSMKEFGQLPEEAKYIREEVFMKEQGFVDEFDEIDQIAKHLVIYEKEQPIATCRIYFDSEHKAYKIGRVAVLKEWRGHQLGGRLLSEADKLIIREGGTCAMLLAQVRVMEFYQKAGYEPFGEIIMDEGCPHKWMKKFY